MKLEPIIKAKMDKFSEDYEIKGSEDKVFEVYVNYLLLELLHPGINDTGDELLDRVCIGGNGDMGMDGIIIFANDRPIRVKEDIDDILTISKKIDFQLVFIQSKNKSGFNHNEFQVFLTGVEDFLRENMTMPANEKVQYWHDIYKYTLSNDILLKQSSKPSISLYYVTTGKWNKQEYILSDYLSFKEHIARWNSFGEPQPYYIDSEKLLDLVNSNDNYYETIIDYVDNIDLPGVGGTKKSTVVLCPAEGIVKLVTTEDGILRKNIFDDNVRDFQGNTEINAEIEDTLRERPEQFQLLNNGITVVCEDLDLGNRRIVLKSPQVVNGCQTCNVLYRCLKKGIDISKAMVVVKFISSDDSDIINSIVRGTNRQNIVYEEAFEVTRDFHKRLEQFFVAYSVEGYLKLYYERRSKQYENDNSIKPNQKINFRILIQSAVGLLLGKVHDAYKHESILLKEYSAALFVDEHSFLPYYTVAFVFKQINNMFRKKLIPSRYKTYEMHIAYTVIYMLNGRPVNINNGRKADKFCKDLLDKIKSIASFEKAVARACTVFEEITNEWIDEKGKAYKSGIKDNIGFTSFMSKKLEQIKRDETTQTVELVESTQDFLYMGKVLNVGKDIHGEWYGFISRRPDNIFFHVKDNPDLSDKYIGCDVTYEICDKGCMRAVNVQIIKNEISETQI